MKGVAAVQWGSAVCFKELAVDYQIHPRVITNWPAHRSTSAVKTVVKPKANVGLRQSFAEATFTAATIEARSYVSICESELSQA